jgi:hypothetical protein
MGTLPLECLREERAESGERRYPSMLHRRIPFSHQESRLLRRLGKFFEEGREFAGAGPEGRSVSLIVSATVAADGRRTPALRPDPIPGPCARENAIESHLSVDARERHQLVKGCERERGWVRLCLGAREKR